MSLRVLPWSKSFRQAELAQGRSSLSTNRHFSSAVAKPSFNFRKPIATKFQSPWQASTSRKSLPALSALPIRFASSTSNNQIETFAQPDPSPTIETLPDSELIPDQTDVLNSITKPQVEPHLGFLKELGLDFGWGPTALMEWCLEHIHVFVETPWWGSITLTLIGIRLLLLKSYVAASDNTARLATIRPHIQGLQDRMKQSKASKDIHETMLLASELKAIYTTAGIKLWKNFVPLIQVPLGYGMFRLMRNMVYLPVPGFEDGGLLWVHNLTVADPTLILPITTAYSTYYMFKKGGELGAPAINPTIYKALLYGMPTFSLAFMLFWPAALQLSFFITSMMALAQAVAFRQPAIRRFLRMHPLPKPGGLATTKGQFKTITAPRPSETAPPPKGVVESTIFRFKEGKKKFQESMNKAGKSRKATRSVAEIAQAKRYEDRRRKEIEQAKLDAAEERRFRKDERRKGQDV